MTFFLTKENVLTIHADQIEKFGGSPGIRDMGLLESALAQPSATFEGNLLHESVFDQAAAYLFHLVNNHPFIDGNKRVALACALILLDLGGHRVPSSVDANDLYDLTVGAASENLTKVEIALPN